jgi:deazaflavin-dependent oxidoreductase (nitroreductase family)
MPLPGKYEPSPTEWVRDQVAAYEQSGGKEANTLRDTQWPIIIVTTMDNRSGRTRKTPVMRVEHDGQYVLVASIDGAPKNPLWYYNLVGHPTEMVPQDGPDPFDVEVRLVTGGERSIWWERTVAAYPPFAEYQTRTTREIPVFVATPKAG